MRFLSNIFQLVFQWWNEPEASQTAGRKFCFLISFLIAANLAHAETSFWSDNFETNAGSRWTTNSTWKIGSPTTGPATNALGYRAYSGSNCVTTGLTGNAPANAGSLLICTNYNGTNTLAIPAASQFPRLRFEQWFDFVNAGGCVEIQEFGSTNWQAITATNLSAGGTTSTSGVWSRPSIDLRAFAGQNVQIGFSFFSGGNGYGNDLGWYIDDVALVTNQPVFNNPESFESGLGDWSVDNGTWAIGTPTVGPDQAHSGTNCVGTAMSGNYGWNVDSRLISPPFLVPTSGNQSLHFWQWYNFVNALGFVQINNGTNSFTITTNSISVTNSVTFTNTIITTNAFPPYYSTNYFLSTNTTITVTNSISVTEDSSWQTVSKTNLSVGSSAISSVGWQTNAINLSAYAGQTVQVAFNFQSGGSGYGNAPGWYIDDVSLVAAPVLTVPANPISVYAGATVTVTNYATLTPGGLPAFTLLSGSPTNATVNATTGVFTWTPTAVQTNTSTINIAVTDTNGLSATNSFSIQVSLPPAPVLKVNGETSLTNGFQFGFTNINGVSWLIDVSTNLSNWTLLTNATVSNNVLQVNDPAAINYSRRFYRAVLP